MSCLSRLLFSEDLSIYSEKKTHFYLEDLSICKDLMPS